MANKTKIKCDKHGLYVRGGGYISRPDYPSGYAHVHGPTTFGEGDEVSVNHGGGPLMSVSLMRDGERVREKWYIHGSYLRHEGHKLVKGYKDSTECYRPSYDFWPDPEKGGC